MNASGDLRPDTPQFRTRCERTGGAFAGKVSVESENSGRSRRKCVPGAETADRSSRLSARSELDGRSARSDRTVQFRTVRSRLDLARGPLFPELVKRPLVCPTRLCCKSTSC